MTSSCVSPKKILYLQDMDNTTQVELENKYEAVISPYDELSILVTSNDDEKMLVEPFNLVNKNSKTTDFGYLVDVNGIIQFPVLGDLHVAGMTRLQLQEFLRDKLVTERYLKSPVVVVRFMNFKIFFLGSDGGKAITISNERCTFLEALALSGG
jgi:Periplasmic protein involved in polysaccharide export